MLYFGFMQCVKRFFVAHNFKIFVVMRGNKELIIGIENRDGFH